MLSRLSAVRRLPRTFAFRYYSDGRTSGSVAQSQGFRYIQLHRIVYTTKAILLNLKFLAKKKKLTRVKEIALVSLFVSSVLIFCLDQYIRQHELAQIAKLKAEVSCEIYAR
jgi:hypothetical protein